jgi:hypothetical protein
MTEYLNYAYTLISLLSIFIAAGAIYGGIRADLKISREKADAAFNLAEHAHSRITEHLEQYHTKRQL